MNNDSEYYGQHQSQYRERQVSSDGRRFEGSYDRGRGGYRGGRGHHSRGPSRPNGRGTYGHLRGSYPGGRDSYRDSYRESYRELPRESLREGHRGGPYRDNRDNRDPREIRESRDARPRDTNYPREYHYNGLNTSRGSYSIDSRDLRDSREPRDLIDSRDFRDMREYGSLRESRDGRENEYDSREYRNDVNRDIGSGSRGYNDHRPDPRDHFHNGRENVRNPDRPSFSRETSTSLGYSGEPSSHHGPSNHQNIAPEAAQGGYGGAHSPHVRNVGSSNHRDTKSPQTSGARAGSPWVLILRIKDPKVASQMESNYLAEVAVNETLSKLQVESMKLENTLATFDVYAKRDALNVEQCNQKLEEFTYM